MDERSLPQHPFDPYAPEISAAVPMIIGTTKDDGRWVGIEYPTLFSLDMRELRSQVKTLAIPETQIHCLIERFRATRPHASLSDIFFAMATERTFRSEAIAQAERKSIQGKAPVYMFLFSWEAQGGQYKAGHALDVPFVFDNLEMAPGLKGDMPVTRDSELADTISATWAAFARTGNPNQPGLPEWKPYTVKDRTTMIQNYTCESVDDPLRDDRIAMADIPLP